MKKEFVYLFLFLFLISLVSADSIGTFQIDKPMQITNYCQSGVCTYINISSIKYPNESIIYPNAEMTQNGQSYNYSFTPNQFGEYIFETCGDSTINVCDKDSFFVNYNGLEVYIPNVLVIISFFVLLFVGYFYLNSKIDYERWYENMLKKYEHKNYVKLMFSCVGYNLIKSKFLIYYFLIFPIIIILTEVVLSYDVGGLHYLFENTIWVYSLGIFFVGIYFFGEFQQMLVGLIKDATDTSWGTR